MEVIIKNYEHYNRALGKYIKSKRQYQEELKKGGFVEYEKGAGIAEQVNKKHSDYKGLSPKAESVIRAASNMKDRKGNIKPTSQLIDAMKEVGVKFERAKEAKEICR